MFNFFTRKKDKPTLFYSTDIHSHILPGIDDGSHNEETSLFLVKKMMEWGITRIIATPHVTKGTFENTPITISAAHDRLNDAMKGQNLDIVIDHSAEYRIDELFDSVIAQDQIIALPNKHILIENSFIQEPWRFDEIVFDLKLKGYIPILAHPERYKYLWHKKKRYSDIHNTETLFQINLLSLAGFYGKDVKEMAYWLLENKMVDLVGTDLHNVKHVEFISTYLESREYKKLSKCIEIKNDIIFQE